MCFIHKASHVTVFISPLLIPASMGILYKGQAVAAIEMNSLRKQFMYIGEVRGKLLEALLSNVCTVHTKCSSCVCPFQIMKKNALCV